MATRCNIGIEIDNGKGMATIIYCHNDGYPSGVGAILLRSWNSEQAARALVEGGDISRLGDDEQTTRRYVTRSQWGDADEPWEDVCPRTVPVKDAFQEEHLYLWRGGMWQWTFGNAIKPLTQEDVES